MAETQIVDADGVFIGGLQLPVATQPSTMDYGVVAVIGCQSGGKSTLLNTSFGTSFPVLNAPRSGRRRTTLGVWAAFASDLESRSAEAEPQRASGTASAEEGKPLLVLDVEGSDSRERGDGAKAFESRTALLSLALADCVVVNMWAHDIGRYSAANYELFETVFAHATTLRRQGRVFPPSRKVRIFLAIRDHEGESSAEDIRRVLYGDLMNIWEALEIEDIEFESLFDVDVILFPHKVYAPEAFRAAVARFAPHVRQNISQRKVIPLAGFESFAQAVWFTVCESTGGDGANAEFTLDIPKHAALAAHFQCGAVMSHVLNEIVRVHTDSLREDIEAEWRRPLPDFAARLDAITREAFSEYDSQALPFRAVDREAYVRRREELTLGLTEALATAVDRYLGVCRDYCLSRFEDEFRPLLGGTRSYKRESKRLVKRHVAEYKSLVDAAVLPSVLRPHAERRRAAQREAAQRRALDLARMEEISNTTSAEHDADVRPPERDAEPLSRLAFDDSDDEDEEHLSVERFRRDLLDMVDERKRHGELMLPGGAAGANVPAMGPKPTPWWKDLLIRGGILLLNYLQAAHSHRLALKFHRRHEQEFPPGPTF